jgi:hypothetical protein
MVEHPILYIVKPSHTEAQIEEVTRYLNYGVPGMVITAPSFDCRLMAQKITPDPLVDSRLGTDEYRVAVEDYRNTAGHSTVLVTDRADAIAGMQIEEGGIVGLFGAEFRVML